MDPYEEISALRARLARLEQELMQPKAVAAERRAAGNTKEDQSMNYTPEPGSPAAENAARQDELRADAWTYSPEMEAALRRLERNADDPAIAGAVRMGAAMYETGKAAARRAGRDTSGGRK